MGNNVGPGRGGSGALDARETVVEVVNAHGLHARPATRLVNEANRFGCEIQLEKDGQVVNAKSIMNILLLAAEKGSKITVRARGVDARAALDAIASLFARGFEDVV